VRLFFWYVAAVYFFGPILAAPFTGGASLVAYVFPFLIFDFRNWNDWVMGCWSVLGLFVIALFLFLIHQFIRLTIRHHVRRFRAMQIYREIR
jgi:hypothetical protein